MAEWLRRRPAKPVGSAREGSNPSGVVCSHSPMSAFSDTNPSGMINMQHWSSGYDDCLTRSRSPVQSWDAVLLASFYFLLYSFFFLLSSRVDCANKYSTPWAHGVVVSRLLRMQKALGSNPSGSNVFR